MRFVPVKNEVTQGAAVIFRARELLVRQQTQIINALRGHLAEFGEVMRQGARYASKLISMVEDPQLAIPDTARAALLSLNLILKQLQSQIEDLDAEIARRARENKVARRLMTIPGIGPLIQFGDGENDSSDSGEAAWSDEASECPVRGRINWHVGSPLASPGRTAALPGPGVLRVLRDF